MRKTIGLLLAAAALPAPAAASITFTGNLAIAGEATDLSGYGPEFGANRLSFGSDLIYDAATNLYYGITDRGPGGGLVDFAPRVHAFSLSFDPVTHAPTGFTLQSTTIFRDETGSVFSGFNPTLLNGNVSTLGRSFDPEGLARLPNGNFLVSDEYGPSVYEFKPDGSLVRRFEVPANLVPKQPDGTVNYVDGRPTITEGRQDNRGYEGITVSNDGTKAHAIMQDPLVNEGAQNDGRRSRNVRIVEYDLATGKPARQFVYQLEALSDINDRIDGTANDFSATNQGRSIGASAIIAAADGSFLVIERDNRGRGVEDPGGTSAIGSKRIYRITLDGATDVSGLSLAGSNALPQGVVPVGKTLFLDIQAMLKAAGLDSVEKLEGVAFGPQLANGLYSLIIASDNDFSVTQTGQFGNQSDVCSSGVGGTTMQVPIGAGCPAGMTLLPTQVYAFALSGADAIGPVPEPATWAMMISGFGLVGGAMRVRRRGGRALAQA